MVKLNIADSLRFENFENGVFRKTFVRHIKLHRPNNYANFGLIWMNALIDSSIRQSFDIHIHTKDIMCDTIAAALSLFSMSVFFENTLWNRICIMWRLLSAFFQPDHFPIHTTMVYRSFNLINLLKLYYINNLKSC